jgi:hypothetical protein
LSTINFGESEVLFNKWTQHVFQYAFVYLSESFTHLWCLTVMFHSFCAPVPRKPSIKNSTNELIPSLSKSQVHGE